MQQQTKQQRIHQNSNIFKQGMQIQSKMQQIQSQNRILRVSLCNVEEIHSKKKTSSNMYPALIERLKTTTQQYKQLSKQHSKMHSQGQLEVRDRINQTKLQNQLLEIRLNQFQQHYNQLNAKKQSNAEKILFYESKNRKIMEKYSQLQNANRQVQVQESRETMQERFTSMLSRQQHQMFVKNMNNQFLYMISGKLMVIQQQTRTVQDQINKKQHKNRQKINKNIVENRIQSKKEQLQAIIEERNNLYTKLSQLEALIQKYNEKIQHYRTNMRELAKEQAEEKLCKQKIKNQAKIKSYREILRQLVELIKQSSGQQALREHEQLIGKLLQ